MSPIPLFGLRVCPAAALAVITFTTPIQAQNAFSILHTFTGPDGAQAESTPIEVSPGVLYGTTSTGGAYNCGTLFSITTSGVLTNLHSFSATVDGCGPIGRLRQASNGLLYGVTGPTYPGQFGSIYRSDLNGNVTVLATVPVDGNSLKLTSLIEGIDGNLYGTVDHRPSYFYRMTLDGTMTVLADLPAGVGEYGSPLALASDGNFYGQGSAGVFQATPTGAVKEIYSFGTNGAGVWGSLVQAPNGRLYGAQPDGILYSLNLDGSAFIKTPVPCSALSSGLTLADDGHIYFESIYCGASKEGQLYRLNPQTGTVQILHQFGGAANNPETPGPALLQANNGVLYGTTLYGENIGESATLYSLDLGLRKPPPVIAGFAPSSGAPGTRVLIQGGHFLTTSSVLFNGTPATFTINSSDFLTVTVPSGAISGAITVTTENGSRTSANTFTIP